MADLCPLSTVLPEIKEKEQHYDHICKLQTAYERAMFEYIEKYILDDRNLGEVFPVAHISAVDEVIQNKYVYGHNVLEHIVEYEDYSSDVKEINERYKGLVVSGRVSPKLAK